MMFCGSTGLTAMAGSITSVDGSAVTTDVNDAWRGGDPAASAAPDVRAATTNARTTTRDVRTVISPFGGVPMAADGAAERRTYSLRVPNQMCASSPCRRRREVHGSGHLDERAGPLIAGPAETPFT